MDSPRASVLVIGGTGVFGSHLCRRLARLGLFKIIIAGRTQSKAIPLIAELAALDPGCNPRFMQINRKAVNASMLKPLGLAAVVDAAGPFQTGSWQVAQAAITAQVNYIDLADAREFIASIGSLNDKARMAAVAVLTGASSTPALSNAMLRELTQGWQSIDRLWVGIVPGNRRAAKQHPNDPPMPGRSLTEAILSWTGRPVRVFDDARWQAQPGWSGLRKIKLGQLGRRRTSLAETPDLDVLVADFKPRVSARFHAGLELGIMHNGLRTLGFLRRWRLLPELKLFAGALHLAARLLSRFGTDSGGMVVEAEGINGSGAAVRARAELIATNGHGPVIPSLAAVALLQKMAKGTLDFRGADHAGRHLSTRDILALVPDLSIQLSTDTNERRKPMFRHVLGSAFGSMPEITQVLHRGVPAVLGEGKADIEASETMLGRMISALFRFPAPGTNVPVSVLVEQIPSGERWLRRYPGRDMQSFMGKADAGTGPLEERFGPFSFRMKITGHQLGLDMEMVSARCGPFRLPRSLTPIIAASERVDGLGRHVFDVSISLPFIGKIVRYKGWLAVS